MKDNFSPTTLFGLSHLIVLLSFLFSYFSCAILITYIIVTLLDILNCGVFKVMRSYFLLDTGGVFCAIIFTH